MKATSFLDKEKKIKKEINRLKKIFKECDEKKLSVVEGLIQESAFMRITLFDLKNDINENGAIDEMPQGEYSILRESPSVKTYNALIQRYTTVTEKLLSLLPKDVVVEKEDGFEEFVMSK